MRLVCVALLLPLWPALAHGQTVKQFEQRCPPNASPVSAMETYDSTTGLYRQPVCVDRTGKLVGKGPGLATKPHYSDAVQYVSRNGDDSNDGLSWGTAKATISSAVGDLPACTDDLGNRWTHCGVIYTGAATLKVSSQITISSPYVAIVGRGSVPTVIDYAGTTGCAFQFTAGSKLNNGAYPGGGLFNITIDGREASGGTCGLETRDIEAFQASGVSIQNFARPGSIGWYDHAVKEFNERYRVQVMLGNNAIDWKVKAEKTAAGYPSTTFGYGNFDVWLNCNAKQTCFSQSAGELSHADVHLIANVTDAGTVFSLSNRADWFDDLVQFHFEQTGGTGGVGFSTTSGTSFAAIGSVNNGMPNSVGGTFSLASQPVGQSSGVLIFDLQNLQRATRGSAAQAPCLALDGQYWMGTVSALDDWTICQKLNGGTNGASSLKISHAGSTRGGFVTLPELNLPARSGEGSATIYLPSASDFPTIRVPDQSGTLGLSGANGISAGAITLSHGSGSHAFSTTYVTAPVCTATDTTASNPVRVKNSKKEVVISGIGSDVIAWICTPATN